MHVETSGPAAGRPVLLLHGGGVAGWMWSPVTAHLDARMRLIVPDLPGHGRSAEQPYRSHDATITELVGILERESAPTAVAGFSLGAQLAVLLAAHRPDLVDRVLVVSAQARPLRAIRPTLALLRASAGLARREWFARQQAKALFISDDSMPDYLRTSAAISRESLIAAVEENIRFEVPPGWSFFPGPALILAGSRERAMMRDSARSLHDALAHSTMEIVDGCGHGIPLQRPEWFAGRLTEWFDVPEQAPHLR